MKKIDNIKVIPGTAKLNLKTGEIQKVDIETVYTYYTDGSQDCKVKILNPLKITQKVQGEK